MKVENYAGKGRSGFMGFGVVSEYNFCFWKVRSLISFLLKLLLLAAREHIIRGKVVRKLMIMVMIIISNLLQQ